jgi:putative ATPase
VNTVAAAHRLHTGQTIELVQGDITAERVDAVVNAANDHLQHGGGVARAIARAGGEAIQRESDAWIERHGPVPHARPAWTSGGRLPAKYVIHAVGPIWGEGDEDAKLGAAVRGSLQVADELEARSVAMPAISTGIFGFPRDRAARILLRSLTDHFAEHAASRVQAVRVVLFDEQTLSAFLQVWNAGWDE